MFVSRRILSHHLPPPPPPSAVLYHLLSTMSLSLSLKHSLLFLLFYSRALVHAALKQIVTNLLLVRLFDSMHEARTGHARGRGETVSNAK